MNIISNPTRTMRFLGWIEPHTLAPMGAAKTAPMISPMITDQCEIVMKMEKVMTCARATTNFDESTVPTILCAA